MFCELLPITHPQTSLSAVLTPLILPLETVYHLIFITLPTAGSGILNKRLWIECS